MAHERPAASWEKAESRFWARAIRDAVTDCWLWGTTGTYAVVHFQGMRVAAHRLAYWLVYGERDQPTPGYVFICHRCDRPACVNPTHLFPGYASDNHWDAMTKGRRPYNGIMPRRNRHWVASEGGADWALIEIGRPKPKPKRRAPDRGTE